MFYSLGVKIPASILRSMEEIRKTIPTIRDLYPHLNEEELKEVEETLDEYLEISVRIYRRIKADPVAYAKFKTLTAEWEKTRMEVQRSNNSQNPTINQT